MSSQKVALKKINKELESDEEEAPTTSEETKKRPYECVDKVEARYFWLSSQMKDAEGNPIGIPVRPVKEDLRQYQFLWDFVSEDLKKTSFLYEGEHYNNPTVVLRQIMTKAEVDFKPASVKGWDQCQGLIKKKIKDTVPQWVPLTHIIPPEFRVSNKKADSETEAEVVVQPSPKKAKLIEAPLKKVKVEQSPKKKKKTKEEPVKKLNIRKILNFHDKVLEVEEETIGTLAFLTLNREVMVGVSKLNSSETAALAKELNKILKKKMLPEIKITTKVPDIKVEEPEDSHTEPDQAIQEQQPDDTPTVKESVAMDESQPMEGATAVDASSQQLQSDEFIVSA